MRVPALLAAGLLLVAQSQPAQQPPATPPPAGAQQPPGPPDAQGQRPVIRSGINFVSVDVIVTDKKTGNVVLDMKPDDFEVREDKKPQKIESFDVVNIDEVSRETTAPVNDIRSVDEEESEARKPNVRLFILLLDDYHVRRGNDMSVRKPLIDFVTNQLAPQDMVGVMYPLTPGSAVTFTRSRTSLIEAIDHFEGRKGNYEPRNEFEQKYAYYPAAQVETIRDDVTMGALRGAAARLGAMREGRKSIIFVSEGFTANLPQQLNDPIAALPGIGNTSRPGQDAAGNPRAEADKFFNSVDLISRLRDVYEVCNRTNTSIYAVDPRGLAAFEYDVNQGVSLQTDRTNLTASTDTLRVLADNTDGRAIVNRNDLAMGMKQIMRDASGYYLLGYTSASAPTDGKFHTIDVRVKRPNVEVRARKGYWAFTTEDVARAAAAPSTGPPPAVASALSAIVEPTHGEHAARFWTGSSRGANGQTRMTFVWRALPGRESQRGGVASSVQLTASASDGHPLFRGRVPDAAAAAAPASSAPASPGAPADLPEFGVSFAAAPGPIDMKIVVENDRGQVIDATTQSVTLPDYAQAQVSLSTPRVYRARTAREAAQIRNDADTTPTTLREFSRGERMIVRFEAYAAGGAAPDVTAKLLSRAGATMADVPVQAVDGKPLLIDFPLASLAAGEYIIEIDAKSPSGTAQQMLGFRVGS